jgi:hypothetical protein
MAFFASAGLHTLPPFVSSAQLQISGRVSSLIQDMMKGVSTATVSPDAAIPPAGRGTAAPGPAIGSTIDLQA